MRRKIFIAVNLDDKTKKFIENKTQRWREDLPLRWTKLDNYHITLEFLGYIEDEQTELIIESLRDVLQQVEIFDITFDQFTWGPNKDKKRILWLRGQKNDDLIDLMQLVKSAIADIEVDRREFRPHITLGRVIQSKISVPLAEFDVKTNILVPVTSVEVMESVVENGKKKYLVMESIELA